MVSGLRANLDLGNCPNTVVDYRSFGSGSTYNTGFATQSNGVNYLLEGTGTVRIFDTDTSDNVLGMCVTNGGNLYVESAYCEGGPTTNANGVFHGIDRIFLAGGASTLTLLAGIEHENYTGASTNSILCPWCGATTNGFGVSNLTGQVSMNLVGGILDYMRLDGAITGNVWVNQNGTTHAEEAYGTNTWNITNLTLNGFAPVQTMNWNNSDGNNLLTRYNDVGTAGVAYTRQMLAPARSVYSDVAPMVRRVNQTDILLENVRLERGDPNLKISP